MQLNYYVCVCFIFAVCITSCIPQKNVVYFQNTRNTSVDNLPSYVNQDYEFVIAPFDILGVELDGIEEVDYSTFNPNAASTGGSRIYDRGVVVNKNGHIEFPYVGKIKVSGLTLMQAADTIRSKLLLYVVDSSLIYVNVKVLSFPVTILGEVGNPGVYQAENEFITVTELLAKAGDVTVYGNRKNIKVIRSNRETKATTVFRLDLTKASVIEPIITRFQPNDVIYVEPLPRKQIQTAAPVIGIGTTILSITALIITLINRL